MANESRTREPRREEEMVKYLEEPPEETFARFLDHARRTAFRLWLLRSFLRGLVWPAMPFAIVLWYRRGIPAETLTLATVFAFVVLSLTVACMWWRRGTVVRFAEAIDAQLNAQGKISGAAEFLIDADTDPFKRLAVAEAGSWLTKRLEREQLWRWPREIYAAGPALLMIYLAYRYA